MELEIEEVHSIIKMLQSEDISNHQVAFELLNKVNYKKNLGMIMLIIKKAHITDGVWKVNCPKIVKKLFKIEGFPKSNSLYNLILTYPKLLKFLINNKCSINSIYLYEEYLHFDINNSYENLGFDMKDLSINVKIKMINE